MQSKVCIIALKLWFVLPLYAHQLRELNPLIFETPKSKINLPTEGFIPVGQGRERGTQEEKIHTVQIVIANTFGH